MTAYITVQRDGREIEVELEGYATPIQEGRYYGPPELCYPDEGGDVEIESAKCVGCGHPVELTSEEESEAKEALWKAATSEWEAAAEDAAIARYEDRY